LIPIELVLSEPGLNTGVKVPSSQMPEEVTICPALLMPDGMMGIVVLMVICFSANANSARNG
jgi:hypothetical protein